ncbi:MAG TPA: hypothetical protein VKH35_10405 [Thermoanaerobaculia bacterium]|nr:hypothetical protein [Thermoanaerobaculia bacterium]
MSEQPPEPPRERHPPERSAMPAWVPTVIGVILVIMAALAVYTGLRYRHPTLAGSIIRTRRPEGTMASGPPGEPEPGSSLMFPDNSPAGSAAPSPNAVHMSARRGMLTNVQPSEAMVYVNGLAIGTASQFSALDEVYDFPAAGEYSVRIVAPGYKELQYVITADDESPDEIARIDVKMVRQ